VHLNDHLELRNVPKRVWEYNIGGYQVLKKWLSYREHRVLRRSLEATEAGNYRDLVRRVGLLVALSPSLDENYARITSNTASWDT